MKHWSVPASYQKSVPAVGLAGFFWENRGDRRHCGVDIYAPQNSDVVFIEGGRVVGTGVFTSPEKVPYWNVTHDVLIETDCGLICRYAELGDVAVNIGDIVKSGELIGHVGLVLDISKITDSSPEYIRKLKEKGSPSMLHFELWKAQIVDSDNYLGGNWFLGEKPQNLLDPTAYIESTDTGVF